MHKTQSPSGFLISQGQGFKETHPSEGAGGRCRLGGAGCPGGGAWDEGGAPFPSPRNWAGAGLSKPSDLGGQFLKNKNIITHFLIKSHRAGREVEEA